MFQYFCYFINAQVFQSVFQLLGGDYYIKYNNSNIIIIIDLINNINNISKILLKIPLLRLVCYTCSPVERRASAASCVS